MAQRAGRWTASRAFAAPDAIMMAPGKVDAQAFLPARKDPPRAVMWWPARATSTGPAPGARIAAGAFNNGMLVLDALAGGEDGAHLFRVWQTGRLVLGVPAS